MKFRFGRRRADADISVRPEVDARNAPEYERIALRYHRAPADGGGITDIWAELTVCAEQNIIVSGCVYRAKSEIRITPDAVRCSTPFQACSTAFRRNLRFQPFPPEGGTTCNPLSLTEFQYLQPSVQIFG